MKNNKIAEGSVAKENAAGGCVVKSVTGNRASPLTCAAVSVTQGTSVTHITISKRFKTDSIKPPSERQNREAEMAKIWRTPQYKRRAATTKNEA